MENKIFGAIGAIMGEIGAIGKEKKNQTQGFMYRGVDDVMNALQPLLSKHHVFIVPEVLEQRREERTNSKGNALIYSICTVKYTFYADDGSSISSVVIGEGMDSGDKATNKAMSIAFKYACFQVFCIPTEEMKDPDAESHDVKPEYIPSQAKQISKLISGSNIDPNSIPVLIREKYGKDKANDLTEEEFCEFFKILKEQIRNDRDA